MRRRLRGAIVIIVVLIVGAWLGSALSQWSAPAVAESAETSATPLGRVRVEVLNGGGVSGLAREAVDELRHRGFDVVYYGNRTPFGENPSVVLDRVGDTIAARAVADALGIAEVRSDLDANLLLDVSVVLGMEWEPPAPTDSSVEEPAWWDPRRFFDSDRPVGSPPEDMERMADPGESTEG